MGRNLVIFLTAVTIAALAGASVTAADASPRVKSLTAVVEQDGDTAQQIIGVALADDVKLPTEVEIPVPRGTRIGWVGEITGSDPSQDLKKQYTTRVAGDNLLLIFTATKSKNLQAEVAVPAAILKQGGVTYVSSGMIVPYAVTTATVAVRVSSGMTVTGATTGATVQKGPEGELYYLIEKANPKVGETLTVSISYGAPAQGTTAGAEGTSKGGSGRTFALLFGGLAVAVIVLLVVVSGQRSGHPDDGEDEPTERDTLD